MIDYSKTLHLFQETPLKPWLEQLERDIKAGFDGQRWGDLPKWQNALDRLPGILPSRININSDWIIVGSNQDCGEKDFQLLSDQLMSLHPWRKGPFDLFGIKIDTEWRSDFKWNRLKSAIDPLKDRLVLDIGCGNGYHCWRMRGSGAKMVLGADPTLLYVYQFHVLQKYIQDPAVAVLPIGIDDLPDTLPFFDTVFSMGLLYHRRSPLDHLLQLKSMLRPQGQLVLETIVIEEKDGQVLTPKGRYACMPNVWFIPSVPTLRTWMEKIGWTNIQVVDVSLTTSQEQRATKWMGFHSLENFLDPTNPAKTIEGHPAPRRAIILANNP
ncbi:MAG: tRNA 5-methoxyuridine(34)/uridine 5-oxyacetic acid(34) synthase CmoB [Candidatus Omnitrophica bacterium]|nr:tRNA 5-methoxyuridine(34)/uridine 5-oxyacetic acid(34) synthase CmoB [Candidatus Omnitrophota bacterium]